MGQGGNPSNGAPAGNGVGPTSSGAGDGVGTQPSGSDGSVNVPVRVGNLRGTQPQQPETPTYEEVEALFEGLEDPGRRIVPVDEGDEMDVEFIMDLAESRQQLDFGAQSEHSPLVPKPKPQPSRAGVSRPTSYKSKYRIIGKNRPMETPKARRARREQILTAKKEARRAIFQGDIEARRRRAERKRAASEQLHGDHRVHLRERDVDHTEL